jgi:crossover junction endodeoxyribonuclease RusA
MPSASYSFSVRCDPAGQPRARWSRKTQKFWTPKTADNFKGAIEAAAIEAGLLNKLLEGPIKLSAVFRFPRPQSHFRSGKNSHLLKDNAPRLHTKKPDLDNVIKATKDALSDIRAWRDDCQVCQYGEPKKLYVDGLEAPVSDLTIELLEDVR